MKRWIAKKDKCHVGFITSLARQVWCWDKLWCVQTRLFLLGRHVACLFASLTVVHTWCMVGSYGHALNVCSGYIDGTGRLRRKECSFLKTQLCNGATDRWHPPWPTSVSLSMKQNRWHEVTLPSTHIVLPWSHKKEESRVEVACLLACIPMLLLFAKSMEGLVEKEDKYWLSKPFCLVVNCD